MVWIISPFVYIGQTVFNDTTWIQKLKKGLQSLQKIPQLLRKIGSEMIQIYNLPSFGPASANPNEAMGRIYTRQTHLGPNFRVISMIFLIFLENDEFFKKQKGCRKEIQTHLRNSSQNFKHKFLSTSKPDSIKA